MIYEEDKYYKRKDSAALKKADSIISSFSGLIILLIIWKAVSSQYPEYLLPGILSVLKALYWDILTGDLFQHTIDTTYKVLIGFLFSLIIGGLIGVIISFSNRLHRMLYPVLIIFQSAPPISWIVLAIIWFGIGNLPPIFVLGFTIIPIIAITTSTGIRHIDKKYKEMMDIYHIHGLKRFQYLMLPAALPSVMSGIKVSLGLSWRLVVTAEFFASNNGIGYAMNWSHANLETERVIGLTLVILILALLAEWSVINPIERSLSKWKK